MKKIMLVAAVLAITGAQFQSARAGEREWARAGKILTGVAVGAVIASAVNAHSDCSVSYCSYRSPSCSYTYSYNACPPPRVVVVPAPVMCAPRPIVVYRAPVVCAPPVMSVRLGHASPRWHGHRGHR